MLNICNKVQIRSIMMKFIVLINMLLVMSCCASTSTQPTEDPPLPMLPALEKPHVRTAVRVWREFVKNPKNGVDLLYDCIQAYPDAEEVLGSLADETGLKGDRVREALRPLATNLLLSYTKILATARTPRLLRRYVAAMNRFYKEKNILEQEYAMLNDIIDQHVRAKVGTSFSEEEARAPGKVLEAVKKAIFPSKGSAAHEVQERADFGTTMPHPATTPPRVKKADAEHLVPNNETKGSIQLE